MAAVTPPSTPPSSGSASPAARSPSNTLDDVFSTSPSPGEVLHAHNADRGRDSPADPSDIPRLRQVHTTAGYRAGISQSKTDALQPGFDEGYSLGATFGWQTGYLTGVLEGLLTAAAATAARTAKSVELQRDSHSPFIHQNNTNKTEEADRLNKLLRVAKSELSVEHIFGEPYWRDNGMWAYDVNLADGEELSSFRQVVEAHPVVRKWIEAVELEVNRAGLHGRCHTGQ